MQRTDWSRRPLSVEQLTYAQTDTHYLPALRTLLLEELEEAGRMEEAEDAFGGLARLDGTPREPTERTVWSMKGSHKVDLKHLATLEALWEWREREAQRLDKPPFKILGDSSLVALAEERPTTPGAIKKVSGVPGHVAERYGPALLRALADGERRPQPPLPKPQVRPEMLLTSGEQARFERLRRWRTETAHERGVSPEIVFNNDTLLEIVQQAPRDQESLAAIPGVGNWKARTYGTRLLALLDGKPARS
jgi:ribonuclease D